MVNKRNIVGRMGEVVASRYGADEVVDALMSMADEGHARILRRFFKTGPGEYGESDRFVGLTNPQVRLVVREAWKNITLQETVKLVMSPLHEVRLCGLLIMVEKYLRAFKKNDVAAMDEMVETYINLHPYVNNWDLVDLSAIKIVGNHEAHQRLRRGTTVTLMDEWIKPGHTLWQRRIAMVCTWVLIRKGMPELALQRATCLLNSGQDLLHKAAGWMLRETWKHGYRDELRNFLRDHVNGMPSVMLSYACEQMSLDERHQWQQLRKA